MQTPQTIAATAGKKDLFTLTRDRFDGVLFDLDGVVTKTAAVHARAWKSMFDEFLQEWAARTGRVQPPFDLVEDYGRYVDGLPRREGVTRFLASRCIDLPPGQPSDPLDLPTVTSLAARKNALVLDLIRRQGVEVYPTSITLINALRRHGYRLAVVSSSANCGEILQAAGLQSVFETRVDGLDLARLQLHGKPAPDAFLEAARRLDVAPDRTAVIEDAEAGVEAGRAGGFGAVIGVDRLGHAEALARAGATVVVRDLTEVGIKES